MSEGKELWLDIWDAAFYLAVAIMVAIMWGLAAIIVSVRAGVEGVRDLLRR